MSEDRIQRFELISLISDSELAEVAANSWLDAVKMANEQGAPQRVALSGGRVAQKFFSAITAASKKRAISLANVDFFWADERCVPPDHPESNFALAHKFLLAPVCTSADRIHRISGEEKPEKAAALATAEIRRCVPTDQFGCPILDIIFLGMGEDGHVASLFPNLPTMEAGDANVYIPVVASKPPPHRITLDYGPLQAARDVWVLASGPGKEKALTISLSQEGLTPLARLLRSRVKTKIFTDISIPRALAHKDEQSKNGAIHVKPRSE